MQASALCLDAVDSRDLLCTYPRPNDALIGDWRTPNEKKREIENEGSTSYLWRGKGRGTQATVCVTSPGASTVFDEGRKCSAAETIRSHARLAASDPEPDWDSDLAATASSAHA